MSSETQQYIFVNILFYFFHGRRKLDKINVLFCAHPVTLEQFPFENPNLALLFVVTYVVC